MTDGSQGQKQKKTFQRIKRLIDERNLRAELEDALLSKLWRLVTGGRYKAGENNYLLVYRWLNHISERG